MNCLDIQDRIVDLILGDIEPEEKEIILRHLCECPICAEEFDFLKECISVCACPELEKIDESYWEEFVISVHEKIALTKPKPKFPYRVVIPIAASAIGVIGIAYFLFFKTPTKEVARPEIPEVQTDPFHEVYELSPEQQREFIKMVNQKYFGE